HFGLGFEAYTHFTSPIRRYPDLLVHRALRYLIRSGKNKTQIRQIKGAVKLTRKEAYPYQPSDMQHFGEICSMTERRADAASYDVQDWLKCEYVQDRVGEEFRGTVSSVTGFGLFVQLSDIYVEGLVHITALKNDYYQFDPVRQMLRGEHSGVSYRLGDPIMVKVARVDLDERKIDLQLVDGGAGVVRAKPEGRGGRAPAKPGRKSESTRGKKTGRSDRSVAFEVTKPPAKGSAKPSVKARPAKAKKASGTKAVSEKAPKSADAAVAKKPRARPRSNAKRRSE
ncbi:MAG: S1 RNA-binding domain-containing protein, partial [Pseudohongiella sp.]|nr:S1 RNA-binding domain-containing protein [Pseudohongiella sp.]